MPIECIVHQPNLVIVKESGAVTLADCIDRMRDIAGDSTLERPVAVLVDKRDLTDFTLHFPDVIEYATKVEALFGPDGLSRIAYVVSQPHVYGTARQTQVMLEERKITVGVFYDFEEAREWVEHSLR